MRCEIGFLRKRDTSCVVPLLQKLDKSFWIACLPEGQANPEELYLINVHYINIYVFIN